MVAQLRLGTMTVDVAFKDIKNVHLSVHPPAGRVTISAPARMSLDTVRLFAISKLAWIKREQRKLRDQARETRREHVERESHYVWGKRYLLSVSESDRPPSVVLRANRIVLQVRPGAGDDTKLAVVERWYRGQLKDAVPAMIAKWEPLLGVSVKRVFVRRMKTRWGSCNPVNGTILLNTELAKKPAHCLEYIVVHEMVHLLEPTHNARFVALMDRFLPGWPHRRDALNRLPVRHEEWKF